MIYNYKCVVAKNGTKMYYKKTNNKWKRISNKLGMKAEKGKRKYHSDIERVKLDIAASFIMTLTGYDVGMKKITDYLNDKLKKNIQIEKRIENNAEYRGPLNVVIPVGDNKDSVHWIYIDNNGEIFDPIKLNMMDEGHQFCQSHALVLAYFHDLIDFENNSPTFSYLFLLNFWKSFLKEILDILNNTSVLQESLNDVRNDQIESDDPIEDPQIYNPILHKMQSYITTDNMEGLYEYLINILDSNYAKQNAPFW